MPEVSPATEPIVVKVDPNLKRLYQAALQALAAATAAGAVAWHRRYEAVASIVEHTPPLYMAGGFATDAAFFATILQEGRSSVIRNLKVVRLATPAEVAKFKAYNLSLAITYVEARDKAVVSKRGAIDFEKLKIQFKRGDKVITRTLETITRPEFLEAIAEHTGRVKAPKPSPLAKAAIATVRGAGVEGLEAKATKTQLVLRVPFDGLTALGKALVAFKPPTG